MATKSTVEKRIEESQKPMSDEEASKFADKQQKPSKDFAAAEKALAKAIEDARKAGLAVVGTYSYVENNVSFNRPI